MKLLALVIVILIIFLLWPNKLDTIYKKIKTISIEINAMTAKIKETKDEKLIKEAILSGRDAHELYKQAQTYVASHPSGKKTVEAMQPLLDSIDKNLVIVGDLAKQ